MTLTQIKPAGLSKPVDLADNERIRLGNGNDLQIYHDSSNSVIQNNTGYFVIKAPTSAALYLQGQTVMGQPSGGGDVYFSGHKDGAFKAYYDNSLKIETTSIGVTVSGDLKIPDGEELRLGSGNDIQLYHDGTHSYFVNNTGNLRIRNNGTVKTAQFEIDQVDFNNSANTEVRVRIGSDGLKLLVDGDKIHIGAGEDLQLYHDGSDSYIDNNTGNLNLRVGGENGVRVTPNGSVNLYYNNNQKLNTTNNGVEVTGRLDAILTGSPAAHIGGSVYYFQIGQDSTNSSPKIDAIGSGVAIPFELNGVEKARISAQGGITFNGDTAAANGLDDYEEGTWSPVLGSHSNINNTGGSSIDTTETFNSGWYTKIGDMVTVSVVCANIHTNHANHVLRRISGLPFTASGGMQCTVSAHIAEQRGLRFVYSTSIEEGNNFSLWGQVAAGNNYITLHASKHTSPYSGWPALFNTSSQSAKIALQLSYKAA